MKWSIGYSRAALKFLKKNNIEEEEIIEKIRLAVRFFNGEAVSVDIRKTKGKWAGYHRIRFGRMRIIAEFDFDSRRVCVEEIDWRGSVYK
jgi:mRNA-degrading endonuclease RelE of RelBE toxin-antitoxin system